MRKRIIYLLSFLAVQIFAQAQPELNPEQDTLTEIRVNPFDHQNKLGQAFYVFLLEFEANGHLGEEPGGFANSKRINAYLDNFQDSAKIPDDLSQLKYIQKPVTKEQYAKLAKMHGYLEYSIIVEKKDIVGLRIDSARYRGNYRFFKLYNERAIIGEAYFHGAIYNMEVEFNLDGTDIQISEMTLVDSGEFHLFKLGNFGYTSDNRLKASNNLSSLIQVPTEAALLKFKPPKDSSLYRVGPSIMLHAGYVQTAHLNPIAYQHNLSENTTTSHSQIGYAGGVRIYLPSGKEGRFNFTIGLGYERNEYEINYANKTFAYNLDCFGDSIVDFEGTTYDEKRVYVSSMTEKGFLEYIQPEFGILYQINLGARARLSLFGNVGYSYLVNSNFESRSVVSYEGKKLGYGVIALEELGFYQNRERLSSGEISNALSFYNAKYGGSFEFALSKRTWLAFAFDMRAGLSPAFNTGYEFCPYLDVHTNDNFLSTFTNIQQTKDYNAWSVSVSYRYQFPKR